MMQKTLTHPYLRIYFVILCSFIGLMTCRSNNKDDGSETDTSKPKIEPREYKHKLKESISNQDNHFKDEGKDTNTKNTENTENIKNIKDTAGSDKDLYHDDEGDDSIDEEEETEDLEEGDDTISNYECSDENTDNVNSETPPSMELQVTEETPSICVSKCKKNMLVPTVKLNYDKVSKILPSDYKGHKDFEEDDRALRKSALNRLKDNFKLLKGVLYEGSKHGINKGQDPEFFTVLPCKIRPIKSGIWYNMRRKHSKRRLRKLATRASMAYTKSTGECKAYNQTVLISMQRPIDCNESRFHRFIRLFFPKRILPKTLHKKTTLCINDAMDPIPTIKKHMSKEEHEKKDENIHIGTTRLELVQIYLARKTIGRSDCFPIYNGMQEIDESTVLCYNTNIVNNKKIVRKKNQNIYVNVLSKYEWAGPLNAISTNDYALEGKPNTSCKRATKKAVTKTLSPKYMLFAGYDIYNPFKHHYKEVITSKIDNNYKPVAESIIVWRLVINGICVGVIPAASSEIALGTEKWNYSKSTFSFIRRFAGRFLRFFSILNRKKAQGY